MTRCGRRTCRHAEPCPDALRHAVACASAWGAAYLVPTVYGWAVARVRPDLSHYAVQPSGWVEAFTCSWTNAGRVCESWVVVA